MHLQVKCHEQDKLSDVYSYQQNTKKEKMASVVYLPWTQNNGQEFMSTYIITEDI
jgi:hypothetical protein